MKEKQFLGPRIGLNCNTEHPQNELTLYTKLFLFSEDCLSRVPKLFNR